MSGKVHDIAAIRQAVQEQIGETDSKTGEAFFPGFHTEDQVPQDKEKEDGALFPSKVVLDALDRNEDGDADLFAQIHFSKLIYDHAAGRWNVFRGHYWEEDFTNEATAAIDAVVEVYGGEAVRQAWKAVSSEKSGKSDAANAHKGKEEELLKRIRALQTAARKKNILYLASAGRGLSGNEWDGNPWLLGCCNGVINLRTGEHRAGRPGDYIRTVAPTDWKGLEETCPTWTRFISEIFNGNTELIEYVQRLLGYCVSGLTTHHVFPVFLGSGRNGKTCLIETISHVLGDKITGQVEAEMLLQQRSYKPAGGPTSDIMNLRGKRLCWVSEVEEGRQFNTAKIKWLTGGDQLTGREMYGRHQVSFRTTHKLVFIANHRPHASASDEALWMRLVLIPFNEKFVLGDPAGPHEHRADPELPEKLKRESSGILAWLTRGFLEFQKQGLNPPEIVRAGTANYRQEEDVVAQFVADCCVLGQDREVTAGDCFAAFERYCSDIGAKVTKVRFGRAMKERFDWYQKRHVCYMGVALKNED